MVRNFSMTKKSQKNKCYLVIHGGAGTLDQSKMTPQLMKEYRFGLAAALLSGWEVLQKGGSAIESVERAVKSLQDYPLFNAGKGAVFTNDGINDMDASIMCGRTIEAGSVSGLQHIKNPISLARKIMENSEHVFLSGEGAEKYAKSFEDIQFVEPKYFYTDHRWKQYLKAKDSDSATLDDKIVLNQKQDKFGTVGAVALDSKGNLAAATSTGGMTNQQFGRIGDSPMIGAGTYANNQTVGISCTGHGEYIIQSVLSHDIHALMKYAGLSLKEACDKALLNFGEIGGDGGVIAIDNEGNFYLPFNSEGMYRGYINQETSGAVTAVYIGDEEIFQP